MGMLHGYGKYLICDAEGNGQTLGKRHFCCNLLGHGDGHEHVPEVNDDHGNDHLDIRASGDNEIDAGELSRTGKVG